MDIALIETKDIPIIEPVILPELGTTSQGRAIDWYVNGKVNDGSWSLQIIPAEVVGLTRPMTVFRAQRKTNLISYSWHGDKNTFCPPTWWDLAIGSGACGLGCRACFLMLTHRIKRDPWRHLLYDNLEDFIVSSENWLKHPIRMAFHTLGVGIDRSDSLLYEGVIPHVRSLAPLFANSQINQNGNKLILLTKTANTKYLTEINPENRKNIIVSFSLNPEKVADLWEGKWPDGVRISPSIAQRLDAAKHAQNMGFEIRIRLDPILTPPKWEELYAEFVSEIKKRRLDFQYWTLGTYREKNSQLDAWRGRWGLLPMEWEPGEDELVKDGTHWHLSKHRRVEIYTQVKMIINKEFPRARISLCKETHGVRKLLSLCNSDCNCLT
jgi:hypothetical protein